MGSIMKSKKINRGTLKQYSKCYNILWCFEPNSLRVFQIVIFPYFISVYVKCQIVLSTGGIFENIFYYIVTRYSLSIEQIFLDNKFVTSTNNIFLGTLNKEV